MRNLLKRIIYFVLRLQSRAVLWKYKPKIIVITGSVGKTSTKDAVYAVLSKSAHVRKSKKSYNSQIGLPLTVLGLPNAWGNMLLWLKNVLDGLWLIIFPYKYPKWLVLEVGVGKPGDMKQTGMWIKSDIVIITAIGQMPAHIEFFNSRKHLIEEKSGLIKTLKTEGLLILNADDESVREMKTLTKSRTLTYGLVGDPDLKGSEVNIEYGEDGAPKGIIFRADVEGSSLPVSIGGVFGKNHVYAAMAALAVATGLKLNMLSAAEALKSYDLPPGRMRVLAGIKNSRIIDDTYNSSPFACESALRTLGEVKAKRKVAVLGDMLELGKHTIEAHKNIGKLAKENAKALIVVGPRAKHIKEGAVEAGMKEANIFEFGNSYEAVAFVKNFVKKGDLILVKGSQGMRMERVVEEILLDKDKKEELLVRQELEWLEKK